MNTRRIEKAVFALWAALSFNMVAFDSAHAQWVPPRGEGSVSIEYQHFSATDHIFSDLFLARNQPSDHDETKISGNIAVMSLDYAIYDRLALNVVLPYINTTLESDNAHSGSHSVDTAPNNAFQDLGVTLRYMVRTSPLFVTTSMGMTWPTHDYGTHGHSAIGRNIRAFSVGAGVARMLGPLLPGVYLQGNYSYSFTEKIWGINMNRSNASVGMTYFPPIHSLSLSVYWNQQITHGGIDWSEPGKATRPEWNLSHDRLAAPNFGQIGGNVSFSVTDKLGIYAGYFKTVESVSENTQRLQGISMGTTTNF